jgi:hypothetical protein
MSTELAKNWAKMRTKRKGGRAQGAHIRDMSFCYQYEEELTWIVGEHAGYPKVQDPRDIPTRVIALEEDLLKRFENVNFLKEVTVLKEELEFYRREGMNWQDLQSLKNDEARKIRAACG